MTAAGPLRVVVIGAGMAGLTAARLIADAGHVVSVLDKGRRAGGRLATRQLTGGGFADYGAQFFTARSEAFSRVVAQWVESGAVRQWCRGFSRDDGHPRYVAADGMGQLAARMAVGLDVRQSVHVDAVRQVAGRWAVSWPATARASAGVLEADVVVLTPPAPQSAVLVAGQATIPQVAYEPTISLLVALGDPPSVPSPGGIQLRDDPTWSWIGDNMAKGVSRLPAVTLHTSSEVATARWEQDDDGLTIDLLHAASPWLGGAEILGASLQRWRYATLVHPHPEPCVVRAGGGLVFAGDGYGGARVEGAFLSGRAAAEALLNRED
ncbi:MAG: NAD(P)/FAD-dependent oxidoreductase [Dermatophilaceae bacterium]|nr:FAD-dependent oxidoreductase [Intrasporangiaceae bacterium]